MNWHPWFCARTKIREELTAKDAVEALGFVVFLPRVAMRTRDGRERLDVLLPSYLLFKESRHAPMNPQAASACRGVVSVLGNGVSPTPTRRGEVERLISSVGVDGVLRVIQPPAAVSVTPVVGDDCEILEGPLKGLIGVCKMSRANRVTLILGALFGNVETSIASSMVRVLQ